MRIFSIFTAFQDHSFDVKLASVMLVRIANMGAGVLLIFVTSFLLSDEEQGYYYTFVSLVAAQFFFDLGIGHMLANLAGRQIGISAVEQDELPDDQNSISTSNQNPLLAIIRFASLWALGSVFAMIIIISLVGLLIFSSDGGFSRNLLTIWLLFCVLSAVSMAFNIFLRLFEGIGLVFLTSLTRLIQATTNVTLFGILAYLGFGLSAAVIALAVSLSIAIAVLFISSHQIRSSFQGLFRGKASPLNWHKEIWPFQRKMTISWLTGYLIFYSQVPILFRLEGPVSAGQMGICVQIFQSVNATANIFLTFAIKSWTALAIRSNFTALNNDFRLVTLRTCGLVTFINVGILTGYAFLNYLDVALIERLPSFWFFAFYAFASILNQPFFALNYYFRAQKKEPLWIVSLIASILIVIVPIIFTEIYTLEIAIITFLIVSSLIILPMSLIIFYINKKKQIAL